MARTAAPLYTTISTALQALSQLLDDTHIGAADLLEGRKLLALVEDEATKVLAGDQVVGEAADTLRALVDACAERDSRLVKVIQRNRAAERNGAFAAKAWKAVTDLLVAAMPVADQLAVEAPAKERKAPKQRVEFLKQEWHYPRSYALEPGQMWEGVLRGKPCAEAQRLILDVRKGRVYFKDGTGAERNTLVLAFRKWIETGHAIETSAEPEVAQRGEGKGKGYTRTSAPQEVAA